MAFLAPLAELAAGGEAAAGAGAAAEGGTAAAGAESAGGGIMSKLKLGRIGNFLGGTKGGKGKEEQSGPAALDNTSMIADATTNMRSYTGM